MPEDFEDRLRRHEEMIQALARVWMRQGETNERMETFIEEQRAMNQRLDGYMTHVDGYMDRMDGYMDRMEGYMRRQEAVNDSVSNTLARIETLLARLPRGGENGHEA